MPLVAPSPDMFSPSGYAPAKAYRVCALPGFAEVASVTPGSDFLAKLQADLEEVMLDCHQPGWDGYDAKAVSPEAYQIANRFIRALPPGIQRPTTSADPDGCITFEWHLSPRRLVLVSVHPDYRIDYAALFGSGKHYGADSFFDNLPTGLCDLIRRVYQA